MTTEDNVTGTAAMTAADQTIAASGRPVAARVLVALLALVAIGAAGYAVYAVQQTKTGLESALADQQQLAALQGTVATLRADLARRDAELAGLRDTQATLQTGLAAVDQRLRDNNFDWLLAEVENLLVIASQRLVLEQDVAVATAALQAAATRLRDVDDTRLLATKKQLAADIQALLAVQPVDVSGLALYLIDIVARVDKLPLKPLPGDVAATASEPAAAATGEPEPEQTFWQRLGATILGTLKDLVKVYHTENGTPTALLPEQRYHVYQNLNLQLEAATHAVLRRETSNFHAAITQIQNWLREQFDTHDAAVGNILDSLKRMATIELRPQLPAIDSSLETLRALIRETTADPQPAAAPGVPPP